MSENRITGYTGDMRTAPIVNNVLSRLGAVVEGENAALYLVDTTYHDKTPVGIFSVAAVLNNPHLLRSGATRLGYSIERDAYFIHVGVARKDTYIVSYEAMEELLKPC